MYTNFEQTGSSVFIYDDKDNVIERKNVDNIEKILLLENDLEKSLKKEESIDSNTKKIKENIPKLYTGLGACYISMLPLVYLLSNFSEKVNNDFISNIATIGCTVGIANAKVGLFKRIVTSNLNVDENNKKIAYLKLFNMALIEEVKLEKEKSKEISNYRCMTNLRDRSLASYYDLSEYLKRHDRIIWDYDNNGSVNLPFFNDETNSVFTKMVKYEKEKNLRK